MTYKAGRLNTDFQIDHFIVGACHTPDAAWFSLFEQAEERRRVVRTFEIKAKVREREALDLKARYDALPHEENRSLDDLKIEADWLMHVESRPAEERLVDVAKRELAHIEKRMKEILPRTLYAVCYVNGTMSFDAAAQSGQREEWKLELIFRAQNYMVTQGSIPHDHFAAMRRHPDFLTSIMPAIERTRELMLSGSARRTEMIESLASRGLKEIV